jgi:hypothetical protein
VATSKQDLATSCSESAWVLSAVLVPANVTSCDNRYHGRRAVAGQVPLGGSHGSGYWQRKVLVDAVGASGDRPPTSSREARHDGALHIRRSLCMCQLAVNLQSLPENQLQLPQSRSDRPRCASVRAVCSMRSATAWRAPGLSWSRARSWALVTPVSRTRASSSTCSRSSPACSSS